MRFIAASSCDTPHGDLVDAWERRRCILRALSSKYNAKLGIPEGATRLGYVA